MSKIDTALGHAHTTKTKFKNPNLSYDFNFNGSDRLSESFFQWPWNVLKQTFIDYYHIKYSKDKSSLNWTLSAIIVIDKIMIVFTLKMLVPGNLIVKVAFELYAMARICWQGLFVNFGNLIYNDVVAVDLWETKNFDAAFT